MKVVRSAVIGYCFGVSNSIDKAGECVAKANMMGLPCYSIGAIIHNKDVVSRFEGLGMRIIKDPSAERPGVAIIRAHGIPDSLRRQYEDSGFVLIDSTCPIVAKGATTLRKAALNGKKCIIIGVKGHAETIGLQGVEVSPGNGVKSFLISGMQDAEELVKSGIYAEDDEIVVVVQTTFAEKDFLAIREYLGNHFNNIRFSNAPCGATIARNKAVTQLAEQTGAVVVIGGKSSENTKGLAKRVSDMGKPVFFVENEKDLDEKMLSEISSYGSVGICSGSSTPTSIVRAIEEILERL